MYYVRNSSLCMRNQKLPRAGITLRIENKASNHPVFDALGHEIVD